MEENMIINEATENLVEAEPLAPVNEDKKTKIVGAVTTGFAIEGIAVTTGLLIYGGLKLGKWLKAKAAAKKEAEAESNEDIPVAEEVKVDEE